MANPWDNDVVVDAPWANDKPIPASKGIIASAWDGVKTALGGHSEKADTSQEGDVTDAMGNVTGSVDRVAQPVAKVGGSVMDNLNQKNIVPVNERGTSNPNLGPMRDDFAENTRNAIRKMTIDDQTKLAQGSGQYAKIAKDQLPASMIKADRVLNNDNNLQTLDDVRDKQIEDNARIPDVYDGHPTSYMDRSKDYVRSLMGLAASHETRDEKLAGQAFILSTAQREGITVDSMRQAIGGMRPELDQFVGSALESATGGLVKDTSMPAEGGTQEVTKGIGGLLGFIAGPAKVGGAIVGGVTRGALLPSLADGFGTRMALTVLDQATTLGVASGIQATGQTLEATNANDAVNTVGQAVKGGAEMGGVFGAAGRLVPTNGIAAKATRIAGVNASMDALNGTRPDDDRTIEKKVFDYGINSFFALHGAPSISKDKSELKASIDSRNAEIAKTNPDSAIQQHIDALETAKSQSTDPVAIAAIQASIDSRTKSITPTDTLSKLNAIRPSPVDQMSSLLSPEQRASLEQSKQDIVDQSKVADITSAPDIDTAIAAAKEAVIAPIEPIAQTNLKAQLESSRQTVEAIKAQSEQAVNDQTNQGDLNESNQRLKDIATSSANGGIDTDGTPTISGARLVAVAKEALPASHDVSDGRLTRDQAGAISELLNLNGQKLVIYKDHPDLPDGMMNSKDGKTVYLNERTSRGADIIAAHEVTHTMKLTAPEAYRALLDVIKQEATLEGMAEARKQHGEHLSDDAIHEEIASDIGGNAMRKPEFTNKVISKIIENHGEVAAKPIIKTFINSLRSAIAKVHELITGGNYNAKGGDTGVEHTYVKNLEIVHDALVNAYAAHYGENMVSYEKGGTGAADAIKIKAKSEKKEAEAAARKELIDGLQEKTNKELREIAANHPRVYMKTAASDLVTKRDADLRLNKSIAAKDQLKKSSSVNPNVDSMADAIAKLGGINRESVAQRLQLAPEELNAKGQVGFRAAPLFHKYGMNMERMAERLAELGYIHMDEGGKHDQHDFEEKLNDVAGGVEVHTPNAMMLRAQAEHEHAMQEVGAKSQDNYQDIENNADQIQHVYDETIPKDDSDIVFHDHEMTNQSTEQAMRDFGFSEEEIQHELERENTAREAEVSRQDASDLEASRGSENADHERDQSENFLQGESVNEASARLEKEDRQAYEDRQSEQEQHNRAQADKEVDNFGLTGSDRAADRNDGQNNLFSPKREQVADEVGKEFRRLVKENGNAFQFDQLTGDKDLAKTLKQVGVPIGVSELPKGNSKWRDGQDQQWQIKSASGDTAYVYRKSNEVQINVLDLKSAKSKGTEIYQAVESWANANHYKFIGDDQGITRSGQIRRTENMISSILRHDTIDHVKPHDASLLPVNKGGMDIQWHAGNRDRSLGELLIASYKNIERVIPEIQYVHATKHGDFEYRGSPDPKHPDGELFAGDDIKKLVSLYNSRELSNAGGDASKASGMGDRTLTRAIYAGTLLRRATSPRSAELHGGIDNLGASGEADRIGSGGLTKALYSPKRVAEEKDLILTHNLTSDNLIHADKMGGIAVPSLAVTHKSSPLAGFGDITLIGHRDMADPKGYAKTKVFGADIYSPRYPNVEYHIAAKDVRKAEIELASSEKLTGSTLDWAEVKKYGVRTLEDSPVMIADYLKSKGIEPKIVMEKGIDPARLEKLKEQGFGDDLKTTNRWTLEDDPTFIEKAANAQIADYKEMDDTHYAKSINRLETDDQTRNRNAQDYAREISEIAKKEGKPLQPDRLETRDSLRKQVDGDPDFKQHVQDFLYRMNADEKIFKGYTNSGNRTYMPHTLENVVKILKKDMRGGEGFNYGVGSLRAKFTPEFKSIAEIRANKDRLTDKASFEKVKEDIGTELFAVGEAMGVTRSETLISILEDAPKMGLDRAAKQYGVELGDNAREMATEFLTKLKHLPTEYFEAKILRDVGINEFHGAVIHQDTPQKARDILAKHGLETREYSNEGDRAKAVESFADELHAKNDGTTLFSPKRQTETPEFKQWFGDSKVTDEEGKPLVVYHGTAADFNEFSKSKSNDKDGRRLGMGWGKDKFYFADSGEAASSSAEYAGIMGRGKQENVMPVYLSMKNPIDASRYMDLVSKAQSMGKSRDSAIAYVDKQIKGNGIDGIVDKDTGGMAVFEPTQIKSATGNNGKFDASNPDIRFSPQREAQDESEPARRYTGPGADEINAASNGLGKILDDALLKVVPMSSGTQETRAIAQQHINAERNTARDWSRVDKVLTDDFSIEDRKNMYDAADEENDKLRDGVTDPTKGLDRLPKNQRDVVEYLHTWGENLWDRGVSAGLVEGKGVHFWTPRMMAVIGSEGYEAPSRDNTATSDGKGRNVGTSADSAKGRSYDTSAETEAAMNALGGELVRDIRTMPMAMAKFEKAVAGRELINSIKDLGDRIGKGLVSDVSKEGFFTLDHPSFTEATPRTTEVMVSKAELKERSLEVEDGKVWKPNSTRSNDPSGERDRSLNSYRVDKDGNVLQTVPLLDENGNPIIDRKPLYIANDFKGPLSAILSEKSGPMYTGYMLLKSKAMSLIMSNPAIHTQVILVRAFGGIGVAKTSYLYGKSWFLYLKGSGAMADEAFMHKVIDKGMVPIGGHNNMLDVGDIANGGKTGSWTDMNESWIALSVQKLGNKMQDGLGDKVKSGIDKAGDFWHNTMLWNRIGDLQAGIAKSIYDSRIKAGYDENAALTAAAHIANRYAGAMGRENMSMMMHKLLNVSLFSKSFNVGNIGTIKDVAFGLPEGLKAQLYENSSKESADRTMQYLRTKAGVGLLRETAITILVLSAFQAWYKKDKDEGITDVLGGLPAKLGSQAAKMGSNIADHPFTPGSYNPFRLSMTYNNEPGKEMRYDMGAQPDTPRHEYGRSPGGKSIEDIFNWFSDPTGTFNAKEAPMVKALQGAITNHRDSYGTPVRDPDGTLMGNVALTAKYILDANTNTDQVEGIKKGMSDKATQLDHDKMMGQLTGFSISQGHPNGPEEGVAAKVEDRMKQNRMFIMKQITELINNGKSEDAIDLLESKGFTPKESILIVRMKENPRDGMSKQQNKKFNSHANEEDKSAMDRLRGD